MQISMKEYNELRDNAATAQAQLAETQKQLAAVTKERDDSKNLNQSYSNRSTAAEKELENVHTFLSQLPDAPAEKPDHCNNWDPMISVPNRLALWLAKRMK